MTPSEPSTSRLPEGDSSDMDSDSDNGVSQIDINSQISTSSGLLSLQRNKITQTLRKRWCGCTASSVLLWANRRGVSNPCRNTLRIFPRRVPSSLSIGRSLYLTIQVDIS